MPFFPPIVLKFDYTPLTPWTDDHKKLFIDILYDHRHDYVLSKPEGMVAAFPEVTMQLIRNTDKPEVYNPIDCVMLLWELREKFTRFLAFLRTPGITYVEERNVVQFDSTYLEHSRGRTKETAEVKSFIDEGLDRYQFLNEIFVNCGVVLVDMQDVAARTGWGAPV